MCQQERLDRILASCLLYCSRYPDTLVSLSHRYQDLRLMRVNLDNIRGSDPPVGRTVSGRACSQLAILYHWTCPVTSSASSPAAASQRGGASRKLSASLALERKMLSIVDVFAIIPLPHS